MKYVRAGLYCIVGGCLFAVLGCGTGACFHNPELGAEAGAAVGAVVGLAFGAKNNFA